MRLTHLDAEFIGNYNEAEKSYRRVDSLDGAQGLIFQCPLCAQNCEPGEKEGRRFFRGAHYIICWFRDPRGADPVPDHVDPKPGRWWAEGHSLDDLSFTLGNPPITNSVLLLGGCNWHGFVTRGDAS
jgi:hypothetical protein